MGILDILFKKSVEKPEVPPWNKGYKHFDDDNIWYLYCSDCDKKIELKPFKPIGWMAQTMNDLYELYNFLDKHSGHNLIVTDRIIKEEE